jgi:hypothetical protein
MQSNIVSGEAGKRGSKEAEKQRRVVEINEDRCAKMMREARLRT